MTHRCTNRSLELVPAGLDPHARLAAHAAAAIWIDRWLAPAPGPDAAAVIASSVGYLASRWRTACRSDLVRIAAGR